MLPLFFHHNGCRMACGFAMKFFAVLCLLLVVFCPNGFAPEAVSGVPVCSPAKAPPAPAHDSKMTPDTLPQPRIEKRIAHLPFLHRSEDDEASGSYPHAAIIQPHERS
jgi:hypothetical protein